jgi:hypothetical protein
MSYGPAATVLLLTAILLHPWAHAASVAVWFAEGVARGFPVLRSVAGEHLAVAILSALIAGLPSSAAAHEERSGPFFVAHRLVDGEVSKIEAGSLFLKTAAGRLKLDVAGQGIHEFKKRERVLLDVTIIRHPDPASLPRGPESQNQLAVQRLRADVTAIQRAIGVVSLNSRAGRLNIDLPAEAIARLQTGDQLTLELGIAQDTGAAALAGSPTRTGRTGLAALLFAIIGRRQ